MFVRPVSHHNWQVLRAAKRSKKPLTGRALRFNPTHGSRTGLFLVQLVEAGLLVVVTGGTNDPFEATYLLTEKGEHAAEYGEYPSEPRRAATAGA